MTKNITTAQYFKGFKIQASENRIDILDGIYEIFSKTVFKRRTFFIGFAVTFPRNRQYSLDNKLFMDFQENFMKHLRCKNLKPCSLWVREQIESDPNQYYNFMLCLSGCETKSIYGHLDKAEELWELALNLKPGEGRGLIREYHDGVMINYGDLQAAPKCFYDASGLSMTKNKEYLPGVKTAGRSIF